jgi:cytoskeletal protein CcmA (bactofilin family)
MFSAKTSHTSSHTPITPVKTPVTIDAVPRGNGKAMPSIISAHLTVKGDLSSDGDIQVDGSIQGDVRTNSLTIGETGSIDGSVTADTVLVAGVVTGQIHARAVTLVRSARVQGDIWHESLAIEAGARFEGGCKRKNDGEIVTHETALPGSSEGDKKEASFAVFQS